MRLISLENLSQEKLIKDVVIKPLKINSDETGILVETLRKDWEGVYSDDRPFAMQYYSETQTSVARDEDMWHYHPTTQDDRFLVIRGDIVTAVADNREDSETKGLLNLFHMKARENPYLVLIPRRTLHGFMVVSKEPAILLNFPTKLYNPEEEGRIPHSEANIKTEDGELFTWQRVRALFPGLSQ